MPKWSRSGVIKMSRNGPDTDGRTMVLFLLMNIMRQVRFSMRTRYGRRLRAFLYISQSSFSDDSGESIFVVVMNVGVKLDWMTIMGDFWGMVLVDGGGRCGGRTWGLSDGV